MRSFGTRTVPKGWDVLVIGPQSQGNVAFPGKEGCPPAQQWWNALPRRTARSSSPTFSTLADMINTPVGGRSFVAVSMKKLGSTGRSISRDTRCTYCRKDGAHKKCQCRLVRYCQESCQQAHWPCHKQVCPCRKRSVSRTPTCPPPGQSDPLDRKAEVNSEAGAEKNRDLHKKLIPS